MKSKVQCDLEGILMIEDIEEAFNKITDLTNKLNDITMIPNCLS